MPNDYDTTLRPLIDAIETRNHSDEDFVHEISRIVSTFAKNAEKNSLGMREAIVHAVDKALHPQTTAVAPPAFATPVTNGTGADWRSAAQNADRQGLN